MREISISNSEWKVMVVLWAASPLTAHEVIKALSEDEDWKPQTVKTLLSRLIKKGAVSYQQEGNRYLYSPEITEEMAVAEETSSFIKRVCNNSLMPLLNYSLQAGKKLDQEEIQALRDLLDQQGKAEDGE